MSELKNQELPLEGVELYMQKAREFLANSAKMDDAPIPWMIAAAFKNEAENKRLRAELKAKDTELAAKEARIAELEKRCNTFMQGLEAEEEDCEALHAELAAKDAKIAELRYNTVSLDAFKEMLQVIECDRAKLGAVSEVLDNNILKAHEAKPLHWHATEQMYYAKLVDGLLETIRSIVEGNHAK